MSQNNDIILERAEQKICPICKCENHSLMTEVEYKGHKIPVCDKHIKETK